MKVLFLVLGLVLFGLTAQADAQSRTTALSWAETSDNETGFRVYRRVDAGAFLLQGESPPSNTACIVMSSTAPTAPTTLIVTVTLTIP